MQITISSLICLMAFFQLYLLPVHAKCCREDAGGDCGDNSSGTPCCGYKACNGFCCACEGVDVIREKIETSGTSWTSVITAPWIPASSRYESWTCRASHITTWYPPPTVKSTTKRAVDEVVATSMPTAAATTGPLSLVIMSTAPAKAPSGYEYLSETSESDEVAEIFDRVSNGMTARINGQQVKVVSKAQYMDFFTTSEETRYGQYVAAKFQCHDIDGDGYLTIDEVNTLCD